MTLEESVKRLEKEFRGFVKNVLEAFREFAEILLEAFRGLTGKILKLPPKLRYKALKCLGMDKDKIVIFFNRENQAKIKEQDRKYRDRGMNNEI